MQKKRCILRRFNSYVAFCRNHFGGRVQKISVDAGFTCPNRDGTVGFGGCTFCNNEAFNPSYCSPEKSVVTQIQEGIAFHRKRYRRANRYLAYFQAYSNTYGDPERIEKIYLEALSCKDVVGIVVGTRPDCVDDNILAVLSRLAKQYYVVVEFGLESCYDTTLHRINRGHTFQQSVDALVRTSAAGIKTGVHIIFGLPGETRQEMLHQAAILSELPINNIKMHQLQIFKNTAMAEEYLAKPEDFDLFTLQEYIGLVVAFTERIHPDIYIERFSSEAPPRFLTSPSWGLLRTDEILRLIEGEFERRNTWQGKYFGE